MSAPTATPTPHFERFPPAEYLATYYGVVQEDERLLMAWLADHGRPFLAAHADRRHGPVTLLDIGCGPTIHHLLPLADLVDRAVVTDLVPGNLDEVRRWLLADATAHDWTPFARACARLLHRGRTIGAARRIERRVRSVAEIGPPLDLRSAAPYAVSADVVTTFFCPCSATGDLDQFDAMLRSAAMPLRPGGAFLASFLGGCEAYRVGRAWYPSPDLAFIDLAEGLDRAGIDVATVQLLPTSAMRPDGFDHIYVAAGTRRR
jgi:NNMT/PNMT/TEMT family